MNQKSDENHSHSKLGSDQSLFVIGDVHGCLDELKLLIKKLPLGGGSTILFLGDLVDRGPDSKGVIDFILELKKKYRVIGLLGNHEEMLLSFLDNPTAGEAGRFIFNGGAATLRSYDSHFDGEPVSIPDSHLVFFRSLELHHETDDFYFVHAGLPNRPLTEISDERDRETLLWIRTPFLNSSYDWGKTIVHGHTPTDAVEIHKKRINMDTGCIYNGALTTLQIPQMRTFSVRRIYKPSEPGVLKPMTRTKARFVGNISITILKESVSHTFETLNYSEMGFLIKCTTKLTVPLFKPQEEVMGEITFSEPEPISFTGVVTRIEKRGTDHCYAILIRKLFHPVVNG